MNFLPISILAYALNGGATVIDKILLKTTVPNPLVYVFYISTMGAVVLVLIPFGIELAPLPTFFSILAGILGNFALLTYFQALKVGEASVVAPVVGGLNPLFTLLLGSIFLSQLLSPLQLIAFFILMLGAIILTHNLWATKLQINHQLLLMILSGFLFALSYLMLREAFLLSSFVSGLVISRLAGAFLVLPLLLHPASREQIFSSRMSKHNFINKISLFLILGQAFGAGSGFLVTYAVSLTSPVLVNSLFGFQYLVILGAAAVLGRNHPQMLDEDLKRSTIVQKIAGASVLSLGVYLLAK